MWSVWRFVLGRRTGDPRPAGTARCWLEGRGCGDAVQLVPVGVEAGRESTGSVM
jgi:hypothetical protein